MVQSDLARQFSDYIEEFTALGLDQFRKAYCHAVLVLGAGSEAGPVERARSICGDCVPE